VRGGTATVTIGLSDFFTIGAGSPCGFSTKSDYLQTWPRKGENFSWSNLAKPDHRRLAHAVCLEKRLSEEFTNMAPTGQI
jgi:hypothetical protein